jgi:hypothetical protein
MSRAPVRLVAAALLCAAAASCTDGGTPDGARSPLAPPTGPNVPGFGFEVMCEEAVPARTRTRFLAGYTLDEGALGPTGTASCTYARPGPQGTRPPDTARLSVTCAEQLRGTERATIDQILRGSTEAREVNGLGAGAVEFGTGQLIAFDADTACSISLQWAGGGRQLRPLARAILQNLTEESVGA